MESPSQAAATPPPSSAAEQARIRRERRQAKLKAEGGSRLNRITSTQSNSRLYETAASQEDKSAPSATPAPVEPSGSTASSGVSAHVHDDPPDVVLSEHYYQPTPKPRQPAPQQRQTGQDVSTTFSPGYGGLDGALAGPSEEEMRQILAQYGAGGAAGQLPGMGGGNDPVMALMQQMMGIPLGAQGEAGANVPQPLQQQQQTGEDKWGVWWKVLHTLGALLLAFWSLKVSGLGSEFDGSLNQREAGPYVNPNFFYYFATMELALQSSRFVIERGRPPPGSMLGLVGQMLPPKIGSYLITVARYSVILTTVMSDAFLIIFVLGIVAWWNSRSSLGA